MNTKESVEILKKYKKELYQKFNEMTPEQWEEYTSKEFKKLSEKMHSYKFPSSIEQNLNTLKLGWLLALMHKSEDKN